MTTMRSVSTLERSFGQLLTSTTPRTICRSCRLRAGDISQQQRQLQTSTARLGLRDRLFSGSKKEGSEKTASTEVVGSEEVKRQEDLFYGKGWQKPREKRLVEGWAKTPEEDKGYVIATTGEGLEHVGNQDWVDAQFDDKGKYKGWSKAKKTSGITLTEARVHVLKAAKDAMKKEVPENEGLDFKVKDVATKFAIARNLRARTRIQISDAVMNRAETLKDFQIALISKPKAKKLSFDLLANDNIMSMTNVQVRGRRQTPIHKDRAVGRWKLIEKELANRGLPIIGHGPKAQRGFE